MFDSLARSARGIGLPSTQQCRRIHAPRWQLWAEFKQGPLRGLCSSWLISSRNSTVVEPIDPRIHLRRIFSRKIENVPHSLDDTLGFAPGIDRRARGAPSPRSGAAVRRRLCSHSTRSWSVRNRSPGDSSDSSVAFGPRSSAATPARPIARSLLSIHEPIVRHARRYCHRFLARILTVENSLPKVTGLFLDIRAGRDQLPSGVAAVYSDSSVFLCRISPLPLLWLMRGRPRRGSPLRCRRTRSWTCPG